MTELYKEVTCPPDSILVAPFASNVIFPLLYFSFINAMTNGLKPLKHYNSSKNNKFDRIVCDGTYIGVPRRYLINHQLIEEAEGPIVDCGSNPGALQLCWITSVRGDAAQSRVS